MIDIDDSKILTIDSIDDLLKLPCIENIVKVPDYETLSIEYDAIHLTVNGQQTTRFSDFEIGVGLYGWDCESVLVMNTECIKK